ncbi:hypothetical protein A3L04_10415 [Thermococcus chitonophagus]|uniref:CARDB domain-containing protein n=1 Tax=Thermococcus chitonophagus TaxID=54262 RepID=A0A160VT71_9EURY|nr:hypothetical protein [Thermococcus chitonophagus]ASJ17453.1 hypothetical protein A3L04_10415 [Thermococcus chitonophagus]CUX78100.1 hypothetical protein CHITON_1321 [Thermococcus chitonophagus]
MRRALLILIILILMPFVSAQFGQFKCEGEVIGLTGSTTSGEFYLVNSLKVKFSYVSIKQVKFFDSAGNEVEGFDIEFQDMIIRFWSPDEKKPIRYSLYVDKNVEPGDYTLYLFMWGFTETGQLYLISAYVPVEVKSRPLVFYEAMSFIKEKPNSKVALTGDTIVVYSHVRNLASVPINVTAKAQLLSQTGKVVVSRVATQKIEPGDNVIRFEIKIPDPLPPGVYELKYEISYERGVYEYSKQYWVEIGISLVNMSIESTNVLQGEENFAYLVVSSDRYSTVEVQLRVYAPDFSFSNSTTYDVAPGSNILKLRLPTEKPGRHDITVSVLYKGLKVGESSGSYLVVGFPTLNASANGKVLTVVITNPNTISLSGTLEYRIIWSDGSVVKGVETLMLPPGEFNFQVNLSKRGNFRYFIILDVLGREVEVKGIGSILQPTTSSSVSSTSSEKTTTSETLVTYANTTTSTSMAAVASSSKKSIIVVLVIVVVIGAVAGYSWFNDPKRKRRKRKKPKRKSPLGRK